jgi:hypothetical protein
MGSSNMRWRWVIVWSTCILLGAAFVIPFAIRFAVVATLASYETVHIAAHLFLYGSLTALCARAGLSIGATAAVVLGVAVLQELAQTVTAGRAPGWPELFDLGIDGIGVLVVLVLYRALRPRSTDA